MRLFHLVIAAVLSLAACRSAKQKPVPAPGASAEIRKLSEQAARADPVALHNLGVAYFRGVQVPRDYAKAAAFWRRAAEMGDVTAMGNLGFLTYHGWGVPAAPEEAVALWRRAASGGQAESHRHLGVAAEEGKGTPRDRVEAYARYRAAELVAARSPEDVDAVVREDARTSAARLRPSLSAPELRDAEARAGTYARASAPLRRVKASSPPGEP